jgi:hypothetical protein
MHPSENPAVDGKTPQGDLAPEATKLDLNSPPPLPHFASATEQAAEANLAHERAEPAPAEALKDRPLEPGVVPPLAPGKAQDAPAATAASESAAKTEDAATSPKGANAGSGGSGAEVANAAKLFPDGAAESAVAPGHASTKAAEIPENHGESDDKMANAPRAKVEAPTSAAETTSGEDLVQTVKTSHIEGTEAAGQADANTLTPGGVKIPNTLPLGVEKPKPLDEVDPKAEALVEGHAPLNTKTVATNAKEVDAAEAERDMETGVAYPPGTDPKTVNVVPAAMVDAPALVVPERGKPIPYMEAATRTLPVSALQKGKPLNEKGEEVSEDESKYTPQPQTPDPLTLTGARPASAYRRTVPVGAEPQPGGPKFKSAGEPPPQRKDEVVTDA